MRAARPIRLEPELLKRLERLQIRLASKVILEDRLNWPPELVAGLDVAFRGDEAVAACVLLSFPEFQALEVSVARARLRFPYVPGFLSFREVPVMLKALRGLSRRPDVVLVDAQGIAHPRRCGAATHLGLVAHMPSVGVAKRRLVGHYHFEPRRPDTWAPLYHEGELVGFVYLSKARCRPIFISPGHMVSFTTALELVRACVRGHKLPEPTRLAHLEAGRAARELGHVLGRGRLA